MAEVLLSRRLPRRERAREWSSNGGGIVLAAKAFGATG